MPTFSPRPGRGLDLDGSWHFQAADLDSELTFAARTAASQRALGVEAGDRLKDGYDDFAWARLAVPGTFSPPPSSRVVSGWYRLHFTVPSTWGSLATLTFQSANYVVDVWLNGRYLGYHEGAWTPFALDAGDALKRGQDNVLVVRVDDPPWGTRLDIVPWGLADWWNYGGITGPVSLQATPDLAVVRADVTPHLDGADVSVVLQNRGPSADGLSLIVEVLPTDVNDTNLLDPDARHLVPTTATPVVSDVQDTAPMPNGDVRRVDTSFVIRRADLWSPARPALYVLRVALLGPSGITDQLYDTFGLRQIKVDSTGPRLLLNGAPVAFHGVAVHDERQDPATFNRPAGGPITTIGEAYGQLDQARGVSADLLRTDHNPANPLLLSLADRMGFGVWEEIPLYHFTPETFTVASDRGVAAQLLAEMTLRDMNHPSVLFHGLTNESTGGAERASALNALRDLDRKLDGTRLTGQAAYGSDPGDATSAGLDVAGFTFYPGVFYGGELDPSTVGAAVDSLHARYPRKPLMILEFGRWADTPEEEPEQVRVFTITYTQLAERFDTLPGGFVGSAVWWAQQDYWTQRPGLQIEHFGLYRPDGNPRPVAAVVGQAYAADTGPLQRPPGTHIVTGGLGVPAGRQGASQELLGLLLYALVLPVVLLSVLCLVLLRWPRTPARLV